MHGDLTRAGLVATNSIRGGATVATLKTIVDNGRIFDAWETRSGLSMAQPFGFRWFVLTGRASSPRGHSTACACEEIHSDLTASSRSCIVDLTHAASM